MLEYLKHIESGKDNKMQDIFFVKHVIEKYFSCSSVSILSIFFLNFFFALKLLKCELMYVFENYAARSCVTKTSDQSIPSLKDKPSKSKHNHRIEINKKKSF